MSYDKIKEIRKRHNDAPRGILPIRAFAPAHEILYAKTDADRATLLAEVDRQREEIERLTRERDMLLADLDSALGRDRVDADAVRKALEAKP